VTDHDPSYESALERMRRLLAEALLRGDLPAELQPDQVQAEDEDERRASALRSFALSGDMEALRLSMSSEAGVSGMNRGSQESPEEGLPELDEARKRVEKRRNAGEDDTANRRD
jgi:hypothetical protein